MWVFAYMRPGEPCSSLNCVCVIRQRELPQTNTSYFSLLNIMPLALTSTAKKRHLKNTTSVWMKPVTVRKKRVCSVSVRSSRACSLETLILQRALIRLLLDAAAARQRSQTQDLFWFWWRPRDVTGHAHTLRQLAVCGMRKLCGKVDRSEYLGWVCDGQLLAGDQVCPCVFYLAGERQCGGHLLHGQVPDAGGERASAGRTAAQLLAARVADQVTRLALQDGRQDIVEAYRALEQRRELRGLPRQTGRG